MIYGLVLALGIGGAILNVNTTRVEPTPITEEYVDDQQRSDNLSAECQAIIDRTEEDEETPADMDFEAKFCNEDYL